MKEGISESLEYENQLLEMPIRVLMMRELSSLIATHADPLVMKIPQTRIRNGAGS
jgi:hypothetical protein